MRKANREITDFQEKVALLDRCDTIRLGMTDDDAPYIVPVSFGYEAYNGKITVYFHGAVAGRKFELLKRHPRVCVEADVCNGFVDNDEGGATCDYESLIGWGNAVLLEGEAAKKGIRLLMEHCRLGEYACGDEVMKITAVHQIELDTLTGKRRFLPRP
ncbi:MAG: pyridoxamine 5'-phosphate oxidase family protein [Clostridiaceae bacterium]